MTASASDFSRQSFQADTPELRRVYVIDARHHLDMVLDCHTHAWGPATEDHPYEMDPFVEVAAGLPVGDPFDAEALLSEMDTVGIDEAVVVGYPMASWQDNWYTLECAREYERLYGIVLVDPFGADAPARLRELMSVDGVIGFRLAPVYPREAMYDVDPAETVQTEWLLDAIEQSEFWETAAETDATATLLVHYQQLDQVVELVETYPEVAFVIDHMARAPATVPFEDPDLSTLSELGASENVLVKVSSIPYLSGEEFPYRDVDAQFQWVLEEFGRERVAWGSDYPFVSPVSDYTATYSCLAEMASLSDRDLEWLTELSFKQHAGIE